MRTIKQIPISIKNQHNLLNLLSEGYKTLSKALMEYIDNAFDSAEEFYDFKTRKYVRDVRIKIIIERRENKITILDNCNGMDQNIIEGLANSINESEKRRREQKRAWINGQFGLGAHAYRFFAQNLVVTSKKSNGQIVSISIDKDSPEASLIDRQDDHFPSNGTLVELEGIDKHQMKNLNIIDLKKDVEVYFEMLLRRNAFISIKDGSDEHLCQPFDYSELDGFEIKKVINKWREGRSGMVEVPEEQGINVFLKVCTEKVDRPPFFARKGRRINYIANTASFISKTEHRKKVWENYFLTGYIEVQENLEPVLARDDFAGGKGRSQIRTGIYDEIVKLEDEIYKAIEAVNQDKHEKSLQKLASALTEILSRLVKREELRLKYDTIDYTQVGKLEKIEPNLQSPEEYKVKKKRDHTGDGPIENPATQIIKADPNNKSELEGKKIERQRQGVKIDFSNLPSASRSHYGDGVMTIFTNHIDFKNRIGLTHRAELGQIKITARLAGYLAAVISSEYKEIYYQQKKLEPSRKSVLDEQLSFICEFEEELKVLINQPLDAIGSLPN